MIRTVIVTKSYIATKKVIWVSESVKILDEYINKTIQIHLRNKKIIKGNLKTFDQHMNLTLVNSEDSDEAGVKNHGQILIRGNAILLISLPDI